MVGENNNPPRNGEGDQRSMVEGSLSTGAMGQAVSDPSVSPTGLPPPRSGEDLRGKHSILGAPDPTIRKARKLRREMTLPEVLLWRQLQRHPGDYLFRKQHPLGPYVLDFACIRARLAIEVDGEAHVRGDRPQRDAARDVAVSRQGFRTLRITARDVLNNMEGVITAIVEACRAVTKPHPPRNGEVARRRRDGGVGFHEEKPVRVEPGPSALRAPPRSGEDQRLISIPPRNGEGDRAERGGGVGSQGERPFRVEPDPSALRARPRSGEDLR